MPFREGDPTCTFSGVTCTRGTENALLCEIDGEEHWIPVSQITPDSEVFDDHANAGPGKLVVTEWIAIQKGLV